MYEVHHFSILQVLKIGCTFLTGSWTYNWGVACVAIFSIELLRESWSENPKK